LAGDTAYEPRLVPLIRQETQARYKPLDALPDK
jgi:hypothetical protein